MDLNALIRTLSTDGTLARVAQNPRAQFGTPRRRYLGATLLPEVLQPLNEYTETGIKYRTVIANAGTRYSPTQKKGGALVGSMAVKLAESDIATEFTSRDYDALLALLRNNRSMDAMVRLTNFVNTTVVLALVELAELYRWQAIVDANVQLRGDNEYSEDVAYSNPANHRVVAGGDWSDPLYDPFDDIYNRAQLLIDKGFIPTRIITSRRVVNLMSANPNVATRTNRIVVTTGGQIQGINGRVTASDINTALAADGLPQLETYDLQYRTSTDTERFLADDVMVFIGSTDRDEQVDLGDRIELVPNTLGYVGVGRPAGQTDPGRVVRMEKFDNKPPRVECEGWQTMLPVVTEPEAIATVSGI